MKTRIAIYGGTDLSPKLVRFARSLTRELLRFPDVVLVSGGFLCFERYPKHTSVDVAVLTEAKQRIEPRRFIERFESWIPAKGLDRPGDAVVRFEEGTVHRISGTDQARRFALVNSVDALVTIAGEGNTRTVLELALALDKPALPIAFTGGDSKTLWDGDRAEFVRTLKLTPQTARRLERKPVSSLQADRLAAAVAKLAHDAAEKRCLVLMPFGRGHDGFYRSILHPAIEQANYIPHRIDKDDYAGNIPALFLSSLERARAVVIDVTGLNPNVMYELGHVHARGLAPLIISRRRQNEKGNADMPFYLRHEKLVIDRDDAAGWRGIAREVQLFLRRVTRSPGEARRAG